MPRHQKGFRGGGRGSRGGGHRGRGAGGLQFAPAGLMPEFEVEAQRTGGVFDAFAVQIILAQLGLHARQGCKGFRRVLSSI